MKLRKYQVGGAMPTEDPAMAGAEMGAAEGAAMGAEAGMEAAAGAPEGEGGGDPVMQLVEMAMQALQSQDPNAAFAVCEGLVSLAQGAGGGAPAPGGAPEEPVMMRKGGKMVMKKGGKCKTPKMKK